MGIDLNNYEAFILDYFEGRLDAEGKEALMRFLEANPGCRKAMEEFEKAEWNELVVKGGDEKFTGKDELKKREKLSEEEFFGLAEGNYTQAEKNELEKIISGDAAQEKELRMWMAAKLNPDETVVYTNKEDLKRREKRVVPLYSQLYFHVAAIIVLLLGAGWLFFYGGKDGSLLMAGSVAQKKAGEEAKKIIELPGNGRNDSEGQSTVVQKNYLAAAKNKKIHVKKNNPLVKQQKKNFNDPVEIEINRDTNSGKIKMVFDSVEQVNPLMEVENILPDTAGKLSNVGKQSSTRKEEHGIWGPEEVIPVEGKKKLRQRLLDIAVTCFQGLRKLGFRNADAVKNVDAENGATDYTLVLGKRSYTTTMVNEN